MGNERPANNEAIKVDFRDISDWDLHDLSNVVDVRDQKK